jgi:hypothetical protein
MLVPFYCHVFALLLPCYWHALPCHLACSHMLLPLGIASTCQGRTARAYDDHIMAKACSCSGIALFLQFVYCSCHVIALLFPCSCWVLPCSCHAHAVLLRGHGKIMSRACQEHGQGMARAHPPPAHFTPPHPSPTHSPLTHPSPTPQPIPPHHTPTPTRSSPLLLLPPTPHNGPPTPHTLHSPCGVCGGIANHP